MKKILIIFGFIIIIICGVLYYNRSYLKSVSLSIKWEEKDMNPNEEMTYNFIKNSLSKDGYGIYTNYLNNDSEGEITKGHSVLSESEGLMMLYAVNSGNKELFDEHFNIVKEKMILKNGLISWRVDDKEVSQVSATIDELRIIKSLFYAYDRWSDYKYKFYGTKISKNLLDEAFYEENLIDFVDEYGKSKIITLCYLDLPTMKILSEIDDNWEQVYKNSNLLLKDGRISSKVPLYKKSYSYETNSYDNDTNADLLLSLITILNRIEAGEDESEAIKWIQSKFDYYGYLVSTYNEKTGEETSKIESPSIYALTALIGKEVGNSQLFNKAIEKLNYYQIKDKSSPLYGGFGNKDTKDVYSFDNLNALLAFQRINTK